MGLSRGRGEIPGLALDALSARAAFNDRCGVALKSAEGVRAGGGERVRRGVGDVW